MGRTIYIYQNSDLITKTVDSLRFHSRSAVPFDPVAPPATRMCQPQQLVLTSCTALKTMVPGICYYCRHIDRWRMPTSLHLKSSQIGMWP